MHQIRAKKRPSLVSNALAIKIYKGVPVSLSIKYNAESALIEGSDPVVILGPNGSGKMKMGTLVKR